MKGLGVRQALCPPGVEASSNHLLSLSLTFPEIAKWPIWKGQDLPTSTFYVEAGSRRQYRICSDSHLLVCVCECVCVKGQGD